MSGPDYSRLRGHLARIHAECQAAAGRSVDRLLTVRSWLIGTHIIEYEQAGKDRAEYGARLLEKLAADLAGAGIRGLSLRSLRNCRQIAATWPGLLNRQTASAVSPRLLPPSFRQTSAESDRTPGTADLPPRADALMMDAERANSLLVNLSFSHLLELSRIDDPLQRSFYEVQTQREGWSVRELKRQRDSMLFERTGISKDKEAVIALARDGLATGGLDLLVRDPYVLEFLGLEQRAAYAEVDLERALLEHLEQFLLELGRDFCFVARQHRVTVGGRHHFIDLLFFHRKLQCLVAIDLKIGAFRHEDAGQMNFYLNYLRDNVAYKGENPPVGIVLCADKDAEEVHYATAGMARQVFVSRYLVALPSKAQLTEWLRQEQELLSRLDGSMK